MLAVGGPAVQQNATLKPATIEVRHEISSNISAFCSPNAVPMQQNHSVSGSDISGCSQPYPGPPVDLRKAANGQSERMAAFGTAHFARERRGWAQISRDLRGRKRNGSFREIRSESGRSTATRIERRSSTYRGRSGSAVASRRAARRQFRDVYWIPLTHISA